MVDDILKKISVRLVSKMVLTSRYIAIVVLVKWNYVKEKSQSHKCLPSLQSQYFRYLADKSICVNAEEVAREAERYAAVIVDT